MSEPASDQSYYWSRDWQRNERIVDLELEQGRYRTFESVADAVSWLDDEDGCE